MTLEQTALNTMLAETGGRIASELEACTRCGMCAEACHFYLATGNVEYTPIWKVELLRRAYEQKFTLVGRFKRLIRLEKPVTEADLKHWVELDFFACTMCNRCAMVCPMGIQIADLISAARTGLTAAGLTPPDLREAMMKQVETGSPLNVDEDTFHERLEFVEDTWEDDLNGETLPIDKEGADTLVVYTAIEVMKFPRNMAAIAKILNAAGENWTLSTAGHDVENFGFYAADEKYTKLFIQRLMDAAQQLKVKRLMVTECGHAYDVLRNHAANLMDDPLPVEIVHITEMIGQYLHEGRIKLKPGALVDGTVTYHDACKIQRRGGMMNEPREVLKLVAGDHFVEMVPNRESALCCGGGGGVIAIKDADPQRFAAFELKMDQVRKAGADTVVMSCSNCRLQFVDGIQHFNLDWKVTGLAQVVADALVED
jgi:Fe-S oxidoreductase